MLNCMIVDDEPLSRDVLRKYIREVKDVTIVAECRDAFEATHQLNQKEVDLIFLDINMPGLSGISFARSLTTAPGIVFTTAYPEYAVEGFDLDAVDYLVKPYSFERFLKAVNKAMERNYKDRTGEAGSSRKIVLKADKKLYAVEFSSILFVEGQGDYIRIHLGDKKLVVHDTIKNFLGSLPTMDFMRIHKSYVVNLKKITFMEGNQARIGEETLPISPANRDELLKRYAAT
ncbi:MAG: response regulator transcription factor [Bacteroidales bacterium]|nr:response regulator transcription factor [Bacteroidales bacterium]